MGCRLYAEPFLVMGMAYKEWMGSSAFTSYNVRRVWLDIGFSIATS